MTAPNTWSRWRPSRHRKYVDLSFDEWNVWFTRDGEDQAPAIAALGGWLEHPRIADDTYNVTDAVVVGAKDESCGPPVESDRYGTSRFGAADYVDVSATWDQASGGAVRSRGWRPVLVEQPGHRPRPDAPLAGASIDERSSASAFPLCPGS